MYSQDCPTRWGTKQKMVARVLEQVPAIRRVLDDRRSQHLIPTWQDIEVLESVNAALKKVTDFTDALSSEKTVTASSVKPVLRLLSEDLLLPTEEDTELTRNLKRKMVSVMEDKYSAPATQQLLAKATHSLIQDTGTSTPEMTLKMCSWRRCWQCPMSSVMAGMEKVPCVPRRLEREKKEVHHLLLQKKKKRILRTCLEREKHSPPIRSQKESVQTLKSQGICRRKPSICTLIRLPGGGIIRLDSLFFRKLPGNI